MSGLQPSRQTPVYTLECEAAFASLTEEEKLYAHHLAAASFNASPAVLYQTSPESPLLFALFLRFLRSVHDQDPAAIARLPEDLLVYLSHLFSNMGNYKSFGDSKFIPAISEEDLLTTLKSAPAWPQLEPLWELARGPLYSATPREQQLGFGPTNGISTYYSYNVTKEETELAQRFLDEVIHLSPYNTRFFKTVEKDTGKVHFELRLASVATGPGSDPISPLLKTYEFEGATITLTRGDYSVFMGEAVKHLALAKEHASNEHERKMLENYIKSFEIGSIDFHKDGSREWVKDKGPVVESYIGFIESYRDPLGVRGEWEGFVAIVNKEVSLKYATLVNQATQYLPLLPWPAEYEKDTFLRPDFTSLEVLGFAGSGIPAGINIPNYDDIRQTEGFKNVSLGNVLSARSGKEPVTFLSPADQDLFQNLQSKAFEVQVALHELLGHGSGKLFTQELNGSKNFAETTIDPLTEKPISSFYGPGKTYDSVFGVISSSLEECRAESVGIYLCLWHDILKIFGYNEEQAANDIIYINWLLMVRAGLLGLEYYTPATKGWRQAHMQARHVILRVLLEAGDGLVRIERTVEDGAPSAVIHLDRSKIQTTGKAAIATFLKKIQVFKSTANFEEAQKLYSHYSDVNEDFLALRDIVLAKKKPRAIYVQPLTQLDAQGKVAYVRYEPTHAGVVKSFFDRFSGIEDQLLEQWKRDLPLFELA